MRNCTKTPCDSCPNPIEEELQMDLDTALNGKARDNLPVVYISGPMSGLPRFNHPKFNAIARQLRLLGFPVLNPADFGADPRNSWQNCIDRDLKMIPHADVILLLDGWEASEGAGIEFDLAMDLGKPAVSEECFCEKVVSRFFSIDEFHDLMELDDYRQNFVIGRFGNDRTKILTRDEAERLKAVQDSVLLLLGVEGLVDALLDDLDDDDDKEGDDDAEG